MAQQVVCFTCVKCHKLVLINNPSLAVFTNTTGADVDGGLFPVGNVEAVKVLMQQHFDNENSKEKKKEEGSR